MSKPGSQDSSPSYQNLSESELLALTLSPESLTDTARRALGAELEHRRIGESEIAAYGREASRVRAREERWRKARSLRLRSWVTYTLLWPLGVFLIFVALEVGVHYVVELVPGLSAHAVELYGGVSQIAVGILFMGAGTYFILSRHGDAWVRRWGGRGTGSLSSRTNRRAGFHAYYCAARSRGTAATFLGFSILMIYLAHRDLAKPILTERASLTVLFGLLFCIMFLVDCFLSLNCIRERLFLGLAAVSFILALLRNAAPGFVAPHAPAIRHLTLAIWVAASLVSLSLFKSALHAGPPGASHSR